MMPPGRSVWRVAAVAGVIAGAILPHATSASTAAFGRTPVVFVHGSGMDSRAWSGFMDYLHERGYPLEYLAAVDLRPSDGDNAAAAAGAIAEAVDVLAARARNARGGSAGDIRVDLVGLSMGAFSTRWYAVEVAPHRVRRWIGLAGANHGTDALCGRPGAGDRQMCPAFARDEAANALQVRLNGTPTTPLDETPYGLGTDSANVRSIPPDAKRRIAYFTISLPQDPWIVPAGSALLDGCGFGVSADSRIEGIRQVAPGRYVVMGDANHDTLPDHPAVRELIEAILLAPDT